ncbi:hypothetical protein PISL3812_08395 [Talaromyces islandicus]|uniref:Methyltransferase type 11 domain-containing protein n=1 Tax=Talaromyces islandicus TaxID=28573 RepID=A0A0U1M722_TALIS|nr:hypothetical protein PISL3812_08395 [Talaromyces islandicus]
MSLNKSSSWDKTSAEYTKMGLQGPVLYPCKRMLAAMDAASSFSSATSILDVGCGPGNAETLLVEGYGSQIPADATLLATDFSQGMVDATLARKQANVAAGTDLGNCWGRLEAQVMDAQDLSAIESGSVSHVMGSLVYFMLPDASKGLREANRVLKEGGVFACTSWSSTMEWNLFNTQAAQRVRPDKAGKFRGLSEAWTTTEAVQAQLAAAGFRDVHAEYVEFDWKPEDPVNFAQQIVKSSNPAALAVVGSFSPEELDRCCEEYVKILAEHGNVCKGVAVLGVGRK